MASNSSGSDNHGVRMRDGALYVPDPRFWSDFDEKVTKALFKTAGSIKLSVAQYNTVPMDTGILQSSAHPVLNPDGTVDLQYPQNYAAKQYFDASLRHTKGPHANTATDHWLDPYMQGGNKSEWTDKKFAAHLKKELGVGTGGGSGGSGNNNNGTP